MFLSPLDGGHGSTIWVTALPAMASPAPSAMLSRRARYISALEHPASQLPMPMTVNTPASRRAARLVFGRHIGISILRQIEDVADIGPGYGAGGEPRQFRVDFGFAH